MARKLRQPRATVHGHHGDTLERQAGESEQRNLSQRRPQSPQTDVLKAPCIKSDVVEIVKIPFPNRVAVDGSIVVAGGRYRSHEVFDCAAQKWTLFEHALLFDHTDGFSFVYDNKVLICGGTATNRMECLDITGSIVSSSPAQLPSAECGEGALCNEHVLTFDELISSTSLKPPFKRKLIAYRGGIKPSQYEVACLNENVVVVLGGYFEYPDTPCRAAELRQDVLLYNPTTKVVKKLASFPYQLADMTLVPHHDGNLIILGGYKNVCGMCNDVFAYNVSNQQCSKLPIMLERSRCAAVIMQDTVVVGGGETLGEFNQTVSLKTAEYLVLGEDKQDFYTCIL